MVPCRIADLAGPRDLHRVRDEFDAGHSVGVVEMKPRDDARIEESEVFLRELQPLRVVPPQVPDVFADGTVPAGVVE